MSTAAEYDEDITCVVDHTADTGLVVGAYGGEAAVVGIVVDTTKRKKLTIGVHSSGWTKTLALLKWCRLIGPSITKGVWENNSKNTDA